MIHKHGAPLLAIAALHGLGLFAGWYLFAPKHVTETAAPAIKQADGSVVLERAPDAKARPAQSVPKGAKVERIEQITVQGETPPEIAACTKIKCPPVKVDMTLVRLPDNTKRVVASSPDGQIVSALDIPVETAAPAAEPPKWAVGLSYDPIKATPGIWLERDVWRARVGIEANQTRQTIGGPAGSELRVRVGFTF